MRFWRNAIQCDFGEMQFNAILEQLSSFYLEKKPDTLCLIENASVFYELLGLFRMIMIYFRFFLDISEPLRLTHENRLTLDFYIFSIK